MDAHNCNYAELTRTYISELILSGWQKEIMIPDPAWSLLGQSSLTHFSEHIKRCRMSDEPYCLAEKQPKTRSTWTRIKVACALRAPSFWKVQKDHNIFNKFLWHIFYLCITDRFWYFIESFAYLQLKEKNPIATLHLRSSSLRQHFLGLLGQPNQWAQASYQQHSQHWTPTKRKVWDTKLGKQRPLVTGVTKRCSKNSNAITVKQETPTPF